MARNCGCGGASCGCGVTGGAGITVTGIGTAGDPFVIVSDLGAVAEALSFEDSDSIEFTVTGDGSPTDPMTVTAEVTATRFPVYPTGGRPSATAAGAGAYYYDSDLFIPAWSDGSAWRDASGAAV